MTEYQQVQVQPKNAGVAALLSLLLPGLGQILNGRVGVGIAFLLAYIVAWVTVAVFVGVILVPAVVIWAMIDAHTYARNWNTAHGIIS